MSDIRYTADEVAELQASEVNLVLTSLLRNLEEVRRQRCTRPEGATVAELKRIDGEVHGLAIAIAAVRRRLRS